MEVESADSRNTTLPLRAKSAANTSLQPLQLWYDVISIPPFSTDNTFSVLAIA